METFMKKKTGSSISATLGVKDMHWIHLDQEAGSHERRSDLSEVLAKLNDYQIFKEGSSMDFVARLYISRQKTAAIQVHGVGKRQ